MGVWRRIGGVLAGGAGAVGAAATHIFDAVKGVTRRRERRQLGFTVAMIALSAKMAKADGVVTGAEVKAFRQLFAIPAGEERNVGRLFNVTRKAVAGYETYARRVAGLFKHDPRMLEDILDGLFYIASADGAVHERELAYLGRVAAIFGFDEGAFAAIRDRHVLDGEADPYRVLSADPAWDFDRLRRHYRRQVVESHPDR
ncbi:MAG TPA: molecular chaperone DjiA, partial [Afifellaceae bacterium]|nr:molecular chaperone DjiA [Afifellaceae bacterium]